MENNILTLHDDAKNRKKAYFAMCKVSLVMLVFVFSSHFFTELFVELLYSKNAFLQRGFVSVLSFFGVDRSVSYEVVKRLLSSVAFHEIVAIAISLVSFVLPAILFKRYSCIRNEECFELSGNVIKWIVPMFFLCQLLTSLVSSMARGIYGFLAPDSTAASADIAGLVSADADIYEFLIQVFCSCIIVPLTEEYVFRGVIFNYLKKYGLCFAAIASSTLFGVVHGYPVQSVYAFCFGIFSTFLYVVTGNLKTSLIFHGVNNFITLGSVYLMKNIDGWAFGMIDITFVMLVTALGFAALYKMFGKDGYLSVFSQKVAENDGKVSEKCGMREIFVFPFVAYVLFYILEVVSEVLVNI